MDPPLRLLPPRVFLPVETGNDLLTPANGLAHQRDKYHKEQAEIMNYIFKEIYHLYETPSNSEFDEAKKKMRLAIDNWEKFSDKGYYEATRFPNGFNIPMCIIISEHMLHGSHFKRSVIEQPSYNITYDEALDEDEVVIYWKLREVPRLFGY